MPGYLGVDINVFDYGGDGPPLLLAHCTGTHARMWDPVVAHLLEDFRVVAPDTRGHGDSEKPENLDAYVWRYSGHDLLSVIDNLVKGAAGQAVQNMNIMTGMDETTGLEAPALLP